MDVDLDASSEVAKLLYQEIHANYRILTKIRFQLLSLVPSISIILWMQLLDKIPRDDIGFLIAGFILSLIALRIIYGIRIYDKRNSILYNDLISRGRKIEEKFKIHTGIFMGRKKITSIDQTFILWKVSISHGKALALIYSSVFMGWLGVLLFYLIYIIISLRPFFANHLFNLL